MAEALTVHLPGEGRTIHPHQGEILLQALAREGLLVPSPCGGAGTCGRCRVLLDGSEVLACQTRPDRDCTVELTVREREFAVLTDYPSLSLPVGAEAGWAIAADLGTTTVAVQLIDLKAGSVAATTSFLNPQRVFGADVVTRISRSEEGALPALRDSVRQFLLAAIRSLLASAALDFTHLTRMTVAGNTTMLYLLLGLPCGSLGRAPFSPAYAWKKGYSWGEVFGDLATGCEVTLLPWVSAYVGGDVTAGLLHCRAAHPEHRRFMLIDLGTNGELALWDDGRLLCTSTAAGPVFEGGNILWGVGGIPGAIEEVSLGEGGFAVRTIGGAAPIGLCGSGVLDAAACLLGGGLADETGLLLREDHFENGVPLAQTEGGKAIIFTQKDLRELQLAKAAIRAGVEILLKEGGLAPTQLDAVYLSGGLGRRLRLESALAIGLLPAAFKDLALPCGNSALGGCALAAADPALLEEAARVAALGEEFSLASHRDFNELFLEYMSFE